MFRHMPLIKIKKRMLSRSCQRRCSFPFLVRWVYSMQSMSIADSGELLKVDEEGAAATVIRLVHIHALLGVTRSPAQLCTPRPFNIFFRFWCVTFRVFLSHFTVFAW
ncbi:uncharacterized protein LOC125540379 [Triticum urartu]|uniref:uncharacterized protein LOC125540379 n=1 Tax=Triticum urartu TaxID=4572 RepID=UPI002042FF35|nr:uncharacterized protein LOC125540379 [Triticum urartu]